MPAFTHNISWPSPQGLAALLGFLQAGCFGQEVPLDLYADPASYDAPEVEAGGATDAQVPDAQVDWDAGWSTAADAQPDGEMPADAGPPPPNPSCDFSGPWLIAERMVSTGLGIQQAAHWWIYYDVEQRGDALRVRKGLVCGTESKREGPLGVDVDMRASLRATREKNDLSGTTGSVRVEGDACALSWGRAYRVMGATMPFYVDPAHPLPGLDDAAGDGTPGWEDWDQDGEPGISVHLSGALSGSRYMATRFWATYSGRVAQQSTSFRVAMDWRQEDSVLGVTSDVLKATATKDGDSSLHFAQFERLDEDVAAATDEEICARVRELAPDLSADGS